MSLVHPDTLAKLAKRKETMATGYKTPSQDEKCIICGASKNVCSTAVMCGARTYWGPICDKKTCLDSVLADDNLIKTKFTLLPN